MKFVCRASTNEVSVLVRMIALLTLVALFWTCNQVGVEAISKKRAGVEAISKKQAGAEAVSNNDEAGAEAISTTDYIGDIYSNIQDYRSHYCKRQCKQGAPPKVCHYYFLLEHYTTLSSACYDCPNNRTHCFLPQCVPADGVCRGLLTANRMVPGPTIDVCEGDTIAVTVKNHMEMGEGTSIHWHGVRQVGTQHMDGTSLVTQCPINVWSQMIYKFQAQEAGTYFWHSHTTLQRGDGLFGGLIIRQPRSLDSHGPLYDYDLPEHSILLADWSGTTSGEAFSKIFFAGEQPTPSSLLINGLGNVENGSTTMPYPHFSVKGGQRYRFRMAYNGVFNCPVYFTVDDHVLLMIASDGRDLEPVEVDAFMIFSGERYDFILKAKRRVKRNFWMRFKGHGRCAGNVFQSAVLKYEGIEEDEPAGNATDRNTIENDSLRVLNGENSQSSKTSIKIVDLKALGPDPDPEALSKKPDKQFYISLGASNLVDERFSLPPVPGSSQSAIRPNNHQLNYITSILPPSPPLGQFEDIPERIWCSNQTIQGDCSQVMCRCTHLLTFHLGEVVELVLVSFTNTVYHPMHMHGHSFMVVSQHSFDRDITIDEVKALDRQGKIPRKTTHAPFKDTLAARAQAVTILRIRADNPGFWFFHCHIELHAELGMSLILQAGKLADIPKPPKGFPKCGNWAPEQERGENLLATPRLPEEGENDTGMKNGDYVAIIVSVLAVMSVMSLVLLVVYKNRRRTGTRIEREILVQTARL